MINKEDCGSCNHNMKNTCGDKCKGYIPTTKEAVIKRYGECRRIECNRKECSICIR